MTKRPKSPSDTTRSNNSTENDTKRVRIDTNNNDSINNNNNTMITEEESGEATAPAWGEWMGGWKLGAAIDQEAERIDRQKAAFGHDTIARLKDLNVLIVGCAGVGKHCCILFSLFLFIYINLHLHNICTTMSSCNYYLGVETAKNLILSNVGGVVLYDDTICQEIHRGTNFYVAPEHIEKGDVTLAEASLGELRTLNPFCRVDILPKSDDSLGDEVVLSKDVLGTHRPYAAIVVTKLLPKKQLFRLNETARANGIAFIMAITNGVTSSIFSDFGPHHEITDATGEPTQTLAISNVEVLEGKPKLLQIDGVKDGEKVVVVTVAQSDHGLEDGDVVVLEDMREGMEFLNGNRLTVKRVAITSPVST